MTDLLLHNARLIDPARAFDGAGFVAITDGVISGAGPGVASDDLVKSATTAIDCGGACLAPGLSIILGAGARALAQAIVTEVSHDLQ